jgi:hypothetical protein
MQTLQKKLLTFALKKIAKGQFSSLSNTDFTQNIPSENRINDPLKQFFEIVLKNHIFDYQNNFLQSKILIKDNFLDTVSQFKNSRNTAALIKSYQSQQKVIQEIKLNFPEDPS